MSCDDPQAAHRRHRPPATLARSEKYADGSARIRAGGYPDVDEMLRESLVEPADPDWVADCFERRALG